MCENEIEEILLSYKANLPDLNAKIECDGIVYVGPPSESAEKLAMVLEKALGAKFPIGVRTPVGGYTVDGFRMAWACFHRIANGDDPQQIISDAKHLINNGRGISRSITGIAGVIVEREMTLTPGVKLVTTRDVPPSTLKDECFRLGRYADQGFPSFLDDYRDRSTKAALVIEEDDASIIGDHDFGSAEWQSKFQKHNQTIDKLICAITLCDQCTPFQVFTYGEVTHGALPDIGHSVGGISSSVNMPIMIRESRLDPDKLIDIFRFCQQFPDYLWKSFKLSTDRLCSSRSSHSLTNRAIDIGIAIESLLMHNEIGPGAKGELRYKVATRGAWLLSQTLEERMTVFGLMQSIYDLRSKAVHSGEVSHDSQNILPEADRLCREMLLAVIRAGRFPDWKKLILGGGQEAWI